MAPYVIPRSSKDSNDAIPYRLESDRFRKPRVTDNPTLHTISLPMRRKWPPPPTVEDEKVSLLREYSPTISELESNEVQMRGDVDQMPIILEIGKENEPEERTSTDKTGKSKPRRRFSTDDSSGPETPSDSNASDSTKGRDRHRRAHAAPRQHPEADLIEVLKGRRRPVAPQMGRSERQKENLSIPSSFQRSASSFAPPPPQRLYPGTLEELKSYPKESEHLGFAQRHRTMSGTNNSVDRHSGQIRHMSAMGYPGESQTPSFPRDHPMLYASPACTRPPGVPEFRDFQSRDHSAIVDSSESDVSPDEIRNKHKPRRTMSRSSRRSSKNTHPRPAAVKDTPRQYSRPSSPDLQAPRRIKTEPGQKRQTEAAFLASTRSSASESPRSQYPSPPASPLSSSRPPSREGAGKVIYPVIKKKTQQSEHTSRPSSPSGEHLHPERHAQSNLRYSSRPSSPIRPAVPDRRNALKTESSTDRREIPKADMLQPDRARPRETAPVQVPRSSVSPRPGLRVDIKPVDHSSPQTATMSGRDARQRPASRDATTPGFQNSPEVPMSAPNWTPSETRQQQQPVAKPVKQIKPNNRQIELIACPRPGFNTKYNDWWTLPSVPNLDLCPDCKDSLQDNGCTGKFVPSQARPPGTQTRCDMNVYWVRIGWWLILAGRENIELLKDLMTAIGSEEPCPGREGGIRKKWYRVYDDDAERHISEFNVCSSCVRSIRILFPNLKGTFASKSSITTSPRVCDLTTSVSRFAAYVDLLENISAEARAYREEPNTRRFIRMARDFAGLRPCQRDDQFRGIPWHYIPHIPDFTICEECFMEVVKPAQRAKSEVAEQVNRKTALPPDINAKHSCQLYSGRMRAIFNECCKNQDMKSLREHAMARVSKERELQRRVELATSMPEDWQEQEMQRLIEEWRPWE